MSFEIAPEWVHVQYPEFAQCAYVLIKGRVVLEDSTQNLMRRSDLSDLYFSLATAASSARSTS